MPWTTYGEPAETYGDSAISYGGNAPVADRAYGDDWYGMGTYGGPLPSWDQIGQVQGPQGNPDLAYLPMVSSPLTYPSGWSRYPGFQEPTVYRDRQGVCHVSGVFSGPTSFGAGTTIGILPPGFFPQNRVMVPGLIGSPQNYTRLDINTDGTIQVQGTPQAGVTFAVVDSVFYSWLPGAYVIDGLRVYSAFINGALVSPYTVPPYQFNYSAGHVWDGTQVRAIPAGQFTIQFGNPTVNTWAWMGMNLSTSSWVSGSNPSWTSEALAYAGHVSSAQPSYVIMGMFQLVTSGALPFNDRRWLPYQSIGA